MNYMWARKVQKYTNTLKGVALMMLYELLLWFAVVSSLSVPYCKNAADTSSECDAR